MAHTASRHRKVRGAALKWLRTAEAFSLAFVVGAVCLFWSLARYVGSGTVADLDRRLLLAMRNAVDTTDPLGPRWFEELVRDFTALGSTGSITFITLSVAGGLALAKKGRTALTAVIAIAGGILLGLALKAMFQRARPDLVPHDVYTHSSSFPSAHSLLAGVAYLTLGAVLARVQPTRTLKVYVVTLALLVTLLVGVSRVYLGVHWPSDVLAGWTAGLAWAVVVWWATRRFQSAGAIEPEPVEHD